MTQADPWQPKWGVEHDAIVAEYKKDVAEGKIKGFVIVPRE